MNSQITEYIKNSPDQQREIMEKIRQLIHDSVPTVVEEFKWSRPVFKSKKDFAYLKTAKSYVNLGFMDFSKLDDPDNRLEGTGKDMRHVKLKTIQDVETDLFEKWIKAVAYH